MGEKKGETPPPVKRSVENGRFRRVTTAN